MSLISSNWFFILPSVITVLTR